MVWSNSVIAYLTTMVPKKDALDLDVCDPMLRGKARAAFKAGDAEAFVMTAYPSGDSLTLVFDNMHMLQKRGIYEAALVEGYVWCKHNYSNWPLSTFQVMLALADRQKLLAASDPLPEPEPGGLYRVYRGVSGTKRRRIRGISWTASLDAACFFATRFEKLAGPHVYADPAVYAANVRPSSVYCYINRRNEQEFLRSTIERFQHCRTFDRQSISFRP